MAKRSVLKEAAVADRIHTVRGIKVMLDCDLAELYGVPNKALKQQVRRNSERFPPDFMFELRKEEIRLLQNNLALKSGEHGGTRYAPLAFSELGVAMLSSILNSPAAIQINIDIMRVFTQLRSLVRGQQDILRKIGDLEESLSDQDDKITELFLLMRQILNPPAIHPPREKIGFKTPSKDPKQLKSAKTRN